MNYAPYRYFLNSPMAHITTADYTTKKCLHFSCGDIIDTEMNKIGHRRIPSRDLSNSHFRQAFSCASAFLDSSESYSWRSTSPILSLNQSVSIYNHQYGSVFLNESLIQCLSLALLVNFSHLESLCSLSVPYLYFEIVSLVKAVSKRSISNVWYPVHIREINGYRI